MKRLRAWISRLVGLLPNEKRERELADEIQSHLDLHIDENLRAGMTPQQARRDAMLHFGGVESTKESYRDASTIPLLENLGRDVRFALRQLRNNPGFTATAVVMLALGICASVAIFAFVDAALIKPLPYKDPNRLAAVFESTPRCPDCPLSYPDYLDWKRFNKVFQSLDAFQQNGTILTTAKGAEPVHIARVTDGFFRTLGVAPVMGRDFFTGEDLASAPRTVMIAYASWRNRFGGRPDIVGQPVTLNDAPHTIVGVLPSGFHFAPVEPVEFWTPLRAASECDLRRSCHGLSGVARLGDGVSVQSAFANMTLIAKRLETQYADSNRGQGANVLALRTVIGGEMRPALLVLLTGAALLLVIACTNVASLLLVRSESRRREFAVRSAIGASRGRLLSQFISEGLVLCAAGSVAGVVAACWAMQLLTKLIPEDMLARLSYLQGLGFNFRVAAFAGFISLLAAVLFSVTPAWRLPSSEMRGDLAEGSRGSAGNTWSRLGSKLVVLELATAMVLLVGAGLLGKSLYRLLHVDVGFHPNNLATLQIAGSKTRYGEDAQAIALARNVVRHVARLPGVQSVGLTSDLPIGCNCNTDWIRVVGHPWNGEHNEVNQRDASSEYFQTLQAPITRGRNFSDAEDGSKPRVTIINQALAKLYFQGEDPIGKQLADDGLTPKSHREIIGVVADIREGALDTPIWPTEYFPFNQDPGDYFNIVVRTSQSEGALLPSLVAAIHKIDAGLITMGAGTMNDRIDNSPSAYLHRSSAWLVGIFAALALLLSVIGLSGVVAYSVSQRTREIGVRMALGAQTSSVYRLILKQAAWLIAVGVVLGLAVSVSATTLIRGMLFGVTTWDAPTLAAVAAVLALAALAASFIPARRAASINPVDALRAE